MEPILLVSFAISFLATFFVIPNWIKRAKKAGLVGKDMHKPEQNKVAEIGGIPVVLGFLLGVLFYIAVRTFYFKNLELNTSILAILSTVLVITIIGLIDDVLGWKIGLRQYQKPLLTLMAAFPVMVVNAGHTTMMLPFLGRIELMFIYPIIIIPLAIVGASNGFNMLAGYNGLESGLGVIILSTLSYIAWTIGESWITVIALCMVFSLIAFWFYNKNPSKIFPGDTLTYTVGALIACVAIFGNLEKSAIILFVPFFLEFILKLRGRFQKESFAKVDKRGNLTLPYDKIYGLEHLAIRFLKRFKNNVNENDVVYSLYAFQLVFVVIVLVV